MATTSAGTPRPMPGSLRAALAAGFALLAGPEEVRAAPERWEVPSPGQDGLAAWRAGRYGEAVRILRPLALAGDADALAGWVGALRETGDYAGAADAARRGRERGVPGARALLGAALLETGQVADARAALEAGVRGAGAESALAGVELGVLEYRYGDRERARALFHGLVERYNSAVAGAPLPYAELVAVGRALVHLSRWRYERAHDALRVLDEAQASGPRDHSARLATAELFLERYDAAQATEAFRQILSENPSHARARFGLARAGRLEGAGGAEHVEAALETNPNLSGARSLLARIHLAGGDRESARKEIRRALRANPAALEALGTQAAIFHLADDSADHAAAVRSAREASPAPAPFFVVLAEIAADHRRYEDALAFARAAAAADSNSWLGWGLAGLNLVRLGRIEEGREFLERAFAGDPFNLWFKNTLDLLDKLAEYRVVETDHFRIVAHESEVGLIALYMAPVAERAYREMSERYGRAPPGPIRIEVFRHHADFSVRTVGLTGLGALGVSFGPALAMDSPAARARGEFNWASTLWHEIAHSFHMALSGNRVPRWFSEGLAVHEQRKGDATWGRHPGVSFVRALASGGLRPVRELDNGFSSPRRPAEVSDTYYQASLVFELLEERHGFQAIVDMLRAYGDGASSEEAFEQALGVRLADFEQEFDAHLQRRFGAAAASVGKEPPAAPGDLAGARAAVARDPDRFELRMILGRALFDAGRLEDAARHFEAALVLFSEYGGADGPHWYLGRIREEEGDLAAATRHYRAIVRLSESHYEARMALARVLGKGRDVAAAGVALRDAAQVHPYSTADRMRAAELLEQAGRLDEAEIERRAVLALDPVDKAAAHFMLARVLHGKGDRSGARSALLAALELAPNYEEALDLLLELRREERR